MFKLTCSYKDVPASPYKVQVVEGRCRIFSVCLGDPSAPIAVGSRVNGYNAIYGKDGYGAADLVCSVFTNMDSKAREGVNSYVDFPPEGILCEDGVWVWMNARDTGITIFHNGGSTA